MKEIKLSNGMSTIVDDSDYDWLMKVGHSWSFDRYAYFSKRRKGKRRSVRMHRLIARKMFGEIPNGLDVDHINRDKLDNRRDNLRLLTRSQNCLNRDFDRPYRGVYWDKARSRWKAHIAHKDLGRFDDPRDASKVVEEYLRGVIPGGL
jgi:hypothetical protein